MLKLNELYPAKGSVKKRKRVARGESSGHGKTSCRGHKGQRSRSGGSKGVRFEGGQTPLYRRLPKINKFKNYPFRRVYNILNVEKLNIFENNSHVDLKVLTDKFFSGTKAQGSLPIKILGSGELKKTLTVEAHKFSGDAAKKIEGLGGKLVIIK